MDWHRDVRVHFARMGLVFKRLYDPIRSHLKRRMDTILFTLPLYPNQMLTKTLSVQKADKGTMRVIDPIPFFYSLSAESVAAHAASLLKPHAIIAMQTPSPRPAWQEPEYDASESHPCRRAFIRCSRDESVGLELQNKMLIDSGVNWVLRDLDSDHSPWLCREAEFLAVLKDVINEFVNG